MSASEDKENDFANGQQTRVHGSITQIVLTNFLTYDHLVCKPGPFLNVILGPNGTGKSSIICGICLAVGGTPKILGRSDNLADFVKHGKDEGSVDVHIWDKNRGRPVVFSIYIVAHKNSANYMVDGKHLKLALLRLESIKYNIQVDNPCTFLAQDKVKSFADQGPQNLLYNTQKAGAAELLEKHTALINEAESGCEFQLEVDRHSKRLSQIELELKSRKPRVDSYLEWASRNKTLKLLEIKIALFEYQEKLGTLKESTQQLDSAQQELDDAKTRMDPVEKSIKTTGTFIERLVAEIENGKKINKTELDRIQESFSKAPLDDKLKEAATELEKVQRSLISWDKDKVETTTEYNKFKDIHDKLSQDFTPDTSLALIKEELEKDCRKLREQEISIGQQQTTIFRLDNQLHSNQNVQRTSMENKLRNVVKFRNNPAIIDAWEFYTKNQDKFLGPVFVPYLHVHIPDTNNLVWFNNVVSTLDLGIFIFSCQEDESLLLEKFRIDSSIISEEMINEFKQINSKLVPELKELGFIDFLLNLFNAPEPVAAYLNGCYNMDKILIGGQAVEDNYERICRKAREIDRRFQLFLTRQLRIEVLSSRYDPTKEYVERKMMQYSNPRFDTEHTKIIMDVEKQLTDLQVDKQKLREEQDKLKGKQQILRERTIEYKEKLKAETENINKVAHYRKQMDRYAEQLNQFSIEKPNLEAARELYNKTKSKLVNEALAHFERLVTCMERHRAAITEYQLNCDEYSRLRDRRRQLKYEKEELQSVYDNKQKLYHDALKTRQEAKDELDTRKDAFKELAKFSPPGSEMSENDRREFAKITKEFAARDIPDDSERVDEMFRQEQKKSSKGRKEGTLQDIEEYELLEKERDTLRNSIKKMEEKDRDWKQKMDKLLASWLGQLQPMIERISNNFSGFFAKLSCAGEVQLHEPEDKYKVADYGIKLLVKFRNGTCLKELNSQTQSGGERSVATMLYILALQSLCAVPFRCVDEINQGMDPVNERAVFNMMVKLLDEEGGGGTGAGGQTQYFMLTPKLLSGLEFNERVTVHVVHNGPSIKNPEHWDVQRSLKHL